MTDESMEDMARNPAATQPDHHEEPPAPAPTEVVAVVPPETTPDPARLDAAKARATPEAWTQSYLNSLPDAAGLDEAECRAELEAIGDPGEAINALRIERDTLAERARERARQDMLDVRHADALYNNAMLSGQWSKSRRHAVLARLDAIEKARAAAAE